MVLYIHIWAHHAIFTSSLTSVSSIQICVMYATIRLWCGLFCCFFCFVLFYHCLPYLMIPCYTIASNANHTIRIQYYSIPYHAIPYTIPYLIILYSAIAHSHPTLPHPIYPFPPYPSPPYLPSHVPYPSPPIYTSPPFPSLPHLTLVNSP